MRGPSLPDFAYCSAPARAGRALSLASAAGGRAIDPASPGRAADETIARSPPALAARLAALVAQAHGSEAAFDAAAANAERLAGAAGAPQSEGWIVAQEALSAAVAAHGGDATALGDIDAISADALQTQGGIAPNDLAAIQDAAAEVGAIDQRQADGSRRCSSDSAARPARQPVPRASRQRCSA